jgi:hypothetical protein
LLENLGALTVDLSETDIAEISAAIPSKMTLPRSVQTN